MTARGRRQLCEQRVPNLRYLCKQEQPLLCSERRILLLFQRVI